MVGEAVFSIGAASEIVGVSRSRLESWHLKGLLAPSVAAPEVRPPRRGALGRRPGSVGRRYSVDDLVLALVVRELLAASVRVERVREAIRGIGASFGPGPLHERLLATRRRLVVSADGTVRMLSDGRAWARLEDRLQAVLLLSRVARTARDLLADWRRRQARCPYRLLRGGRNGAADGRERG